MCVQHVDIGDVHGKCRATMQRAGCCESLTVKMLSCSETPFDWRQEAVQDPDPKGRSSRAKQPVLINHASDVRYTACSSCVLPHSTTVERVGCKGCNLVPQNEI